MMNSTEVAGGLYYLDVRKVTVAKIITVSLGKVKANRSCCMVG